MAGEVEGASISRIRFCSPTLRLYNIEDQLVSSTGSVCRHWEGRIDRIGDVSTIVGPAGHVERAVASIKPHDLLRRSVTGGRYQPEEAVGIGRMADFVACHR